ncbi:MAG: DUF5723 family protein [Bacteroidota bacterium]
MKKIHIVATLLTLFSCLALTAQINIGTQFLPEVLQRNKWNSASMQEVNVQVNIGSSEAFLGNEFSLNDFLVDIPNTDSQQVSFENAYNLMDESNLIRVDYSLDLFNLYIAAQELDMQFGFSYGTRSHTQLSYSRDIFGLIFRGNGAYIGEAVEIGPSFSSMVYGDLAVSVAKKINDKFQVGGRVHYLNGIFNVTTTRDQLSIFTSDEYYQITLDADYELNASVPDLDITGSLDSIGISSNLTLPALISPGGFNGNHGFALDVAGIFKPTEQLEITAGVNNLGRIGWNNSQQQFSLNGSFTYEGITANTNNGEGILENLLDFNFETALDSFGDSFEVDTRESQRYSTGIPARYFASAMYQPVKNLTLGGTVAHETFNGSGHTTIGLYGGLRVDHTISIGLSFANDTEFGSVFGLHGNLNLAGLQFYGSVENLAATFDPTRTNTVMSRFGVNLLFGRWWKQGKNSEGVQTRL